MTWDLPDQPYRLVKQSVAEADPEPQALACPGLLRADKNQAGLRFVDG